jgi:hypothetical protein
MDIPNIVFLVNVGLILEIHSNIFLPFFCNILSPFLCLHFYCVDKRNFCMFISKMLVLFFSPKVHLNIYKTNIMALNDLPKV